jgi:hypothetical protein
MNLEPAAGYNPEADVCPAGTTRQTTLFSDDLESGLGNWTTGYLPNLGYDPTYVAWGLDALLDDDVTYYYYAHSGSHSLYADDTINYFPSGDRSDSYAALAPVAPPASRHLCASPRLRL